MEPRVQEVLARVSNGVCKKVRATRCLCVYRNRGSHVAIRRDHDASQRTWRDREVGATLGSVLPRPVVPSIEQGVCRGVEGGDRRLRKNLQQCHSHAYACVGSSLQSNSAWGGGGFNVGDRSLFGEQAGGSKRTGDAE